MYTSVETRFYRGLVLRAPGQPTRSHWTGPLVYLPIQGQSWGSTWLFPLLVEEHKTYPQDTCNEGGQGNPGGQRKSRVQTDITRCGVNKHQTNQISPNEWMNKEDNVTNDTITQYRRHDRDDTRTRTGRTSPSLFHTSHKSPYYLPSILSLSPLTIY